VVVFVPDRDHAMIAIGPSGPCAPPQAAVPFEARHADGDIGGRPRRAELAVER
jgi:hypothetical protein